MEEDDVRDRNQSDKNTKVVIKIPSYHEVMETSQSRSAPTSLFAPSQTFSQAFAHLKSSELYAPPPPAKPPETSANSHPQSQSSDTGASRDTGNSNVSSSGPSASTSAGAPSAQNRNAILVSHRQKGNPLLKHIRNAKWIFADVVCDYLLGQSSCALYLSLRYHLLHPDYLYYRIRELQKNFKLRVVLCHVDVEDVVKPLLEVTKTALLHDCTLLCAWRYRKIMGSNRDFDDFSSRSRFSVNLNNSSRSCLEECGRYLETIKVYENKSADIIQGQMDNDYLSRLNHALTTIRHVNKTDVVTLGSTFGSLSNIMDASMEDLARCPGIGERKVKRLYDTFHEPFKRVVPSYPSCPETSTQNTAEPNSAHTDTEANDTEHERKRQNKDPEMTVKSALSTAFAKYANKIGRKNSGSQAAEKAGKENQ